MAETQELSCEIERFEMESQFGLQIRLIDALGNLRGLFDLVRAISRVVGIRLVFLVCFRFADAAAVVHLHRLGFRRGFVGKQLQAAAERV